MNVGLRNELSALGLLLGGGLLLARKPRWALACAGLSAGIRLLKSPREFSFDRKTVVITGGSRGLGLALASELVKRGARVVLLARDGTELARAKEKLEDGPRVNVLALLCDVTEPSQVSAALQKTRDQFGSLDVLINNAGAISAGPFLSQADSDFSALLRIHLEAAIHTTRLALPHFQDQGGGRIVNISSIGGKIPVPHMSSYCASKFALAGFSESTAMELEAKNIRVTTVYPGLMRTGSPVQAVFKGDTEKEFALFLLMDSVPGVSISATRAAHQILDAVEEGRSQITVSIPAKIASFVSANFPNLFRALATGATRLLPDDISGERRTGAQDLPALSGKWWMAPVLRVLRKAQKDWNQREKTDAGFNLGLRENEEGPLREPSFQSQR